MTSNTKTKLCWNCEARVERSQEHCPFCGVYLSPEFSESPKAVLSPLYRFDEESIDELEDKEDKGHSNHLKETPVSKETPINSFVLALIFLFFGTTFFLFSIALALFSQEGVLTLHWNSSMWPFLLACSLAAMFSGWRLVGKALE